MGLKLYINLFFIITASYAFVLPTATEKCNAEEVLSIINDYLNVLDEKINNSTLIINEKLEEVTNRTYESRETLIIQTALNEIKVDLQNLKAGLCSDDLHLQFDFRISGLDSLEVKCATKSSKKEISLRSKAEAALKKAESSKAKATLALQKCGTKVVGDCIQVSTCCDQALQKSTGKIDSTAAYIDQNLELVESVQNECYKKVALAGLKIEASIKEEILECKLQEVTTESSTSAGSGNDNPEENSNGPTEKSNGDGTIGSTTIQNEKYVTDDDNERRTTAENISTAVDLEKTETVELSEGVSASTQKGDTSGLKPDPEDTAEIAVNAPTEDDLPDGNEEESNDEQHNEEQEIEIQQNNENPNEEQNEKDDDNQNVRQQNDEEEQEPGNDQNMEDAEHNQNVDQENDEPTNEDKEEDHTVLQNKEDQNDAPQNDVQSKENNNENVEEQSINDDNEKSSTQLTIIDCSNEISREINY